MLIPSIRETSVYFGKHELFSNSHTEWVTRTIKNMAKTNSRVIPVMDSIRYIFSPGYNANEMTLYLGMLTFWNILTETFQIRYQIAMITDSKMSNEFRVSSNIYNDEIKKTMKTIEQKSISLNLAGTQLTAFFLTILTPELSYLRHTIKNGCLNKTSSGQIPYLVIYDYLVQATHKKLIENDMYIPISEDIEDRKSTSCVTLFIK